MDKITILDNFDKQELQNQIDAIKEQDSVQPDWNQNDATQPGYIKNRTHYIDKPSEVITFDGDTNGKDFIDLSDNNLIVKVSDNTYTVEELIGALVFTNVGDSARLTEE